MKLSIEPFQGKNDPDIYIEGERKVEQILIVIIIQNKRKLSSRMLILLIMLLFGVIS